MRKAALTLIVLLGFICGIARADVQGNPLKVDIDDHGNIRVYVQYVIDGVELVTNYPLLPELGDKHYLVVRFDAYNFVGMSAEQKKQKIRDEIKKHAEYIISSTFLKKENIEVLDDVKTIVGEEIDVKDATVKFDTNKDGQEDTEWTVKSDGTKTEKPIVPVVGDIVNP